MSELRTAKQFYDFFSKIPFWKWTTGRAENRLGQRCAVGHVVAEFGGNGWNHMYRPGQGWQTVDPKPLQTASFGSLFSF